METVKTVENIKAFLPLTLMEGKRSLLHLESSGEAKEYVALCSINKKHEKLAEFLYKAANSHYELLEALKAIESLPVFGDGYLPAQEIFDIINKVKNKTS